MSRRIVLRLAAAAGAGLSLTGCLGLDLGFGPFAGGDDSAPATKQLSAETVAALAQKGMRPEAPIFVRIFKEESELEIWKAKDDGRFYLFRTYPICAWSGSLGPKIREGDKQAPEGFYTVGMNQLNPNSQYHLSFNLGFPNTYDRANAHTGGALMVHGNCKSAGCYAMTDALIEEIYGLAHESLQGGQREFHVQALPFRMNDFNMLRHRLSEWYDFWRTLKEGYDYFEDAHVPPKVSVCQRQYMVNVAFNGDVKPDPVGACPVYAKISPKPQPWRSPLSPVSPGSGGAPVMVAKFPTQGQPAVQTASAAPAADAAPAPTASAIRPAQAPATSPIQTAAAARPGAAPVVSAAPPQRVPAAPAARPAGPAQQPAPQAVVASAQSAQPAPPSQPRQRFEPVYTPNTGAADRGYLSNMNPPPREASAPAPAQPAPQPRPSMAQMVAQKGDTEGEQRVLKAGKSDRLTPSAPPAQAPASEPASAPPAESSSGQMNMFGYAPAGGR